MNFEIEKIISPLFPILNPIWASINAVARKYYASRSHQFSVPVISVGNILAGGTGKTELVAKIAKHIIDKNLSVVVAMRGFGSECKNNSEFDEALVLQEKVPGIKLVIGKHRRENLIKYFDNAKPDVILLDDGFQHFKIKRDLDVLVHDFSIRPPLLRDYPSVLGSVPVRICFSEVPKTWRSLSWVRAQYKLKAVRSKNNEVATLPKQAILCCGIGNPTRVEKKLLEWGCEVREKIFFKDHHKYQESELKKLSELQRKLKLPILTTLKDFVKIKPLLSAVPLELFWIDIDIEFLENEHILWKAVDLIK